MIDDKAKKTRHYQDIERLTAERDALKAKLDAQLALHEQGRAENERLRAELKGEREPGCECQWEIGDSLCPAHPTNPATELPYTSREAGELAVQLTELREAAERAVRRMRPYDVAGAADLEAVLAKVTQ